MADVGPKPEEPHAVSKLEETDAKQEENKDWTWDIVCALGYPFRCSSDRMSLSLPGIVWWMIFIPNLVFLTLVTFHIGEERGKFGTMVNHGHTTLRHLLLRNWDASFETLPYPPAHGAFAVYDITEMEESINYAVKQYYNAKALATGNFLSTEDDEIKISILYYTMNYNSETKSYSNLRVIENPPFPPNHGLSNSTVDGLTLYNYSIKDELRTQNLSLNDQGILKVDIIMSLHSIRVDKHHRAMCLKIYANVTFDDDDHNGQVTIDLSTETYNIKCSSIRYNIRETMEQNPFNDGKMTASIVLLSISIFVEFAIFIFRIIDCIRVKSRRCREHSNFQILVKNLISIFETVVALLGDGFALAAEYIIKRQNEPTKLQEYDEPIVLLGIGLLMSYGTALRFVNCTKNFTLLFKTIKTSFWAVTSFLFCATILFLGYWAFGYVVLGLYHIKFNTMDRAADSLFSMMNGDEIYATMAILRADDAGNEGLIRIMMHLFVYTYVLLFTVLVFNLLIALFNSAYEHIQAQNKQEEEDKEKDCLCFPKNLPCCSESSETCCKMPKCCCQCPKQNSNDKERLLKDVDLRLKDDKQSSTKSLSEPLTSNV